MSQKPQKQIIPLLKESVNSLIANPIILFPFITTAFIQLLILEIIYFSARFPLVYFFGPMIRKLNGELSGEIYLHYPQHLLILPKWFQITQYFIFIFVSSFLTAVAIDIIKNINNNKKATFPGALRDMLPRYVHICIAAFISFFLFFGISKMHELIIAKAMHIRSETGIFYLIKAIVLYGAPYFGLLTGIFVTALFAFVLPIIVIKQKKVFSAIILNFKYLWGSFWFVFFIVLIPMLFYVPVLLVQNNLSSVANFTFEGVRMISLVLGVFVMALIDATVYTAITTHYLMMKENP